MDIKIIDITSLRAAHRKWTSRPGTEPDAIITPNVNNGVVAKIVGPNNTDSYLRRSDLALILTNDQPDGTPSEEVFNAVYLDWGNFTVVDTLEWNHFCASLNFSGSNNAILMTKTGTIEVTATSAATAEPVAKLLLIIGNRNVNEQSQVYYYGISATLGYYYDSENTSLKRVVKLENKSFNTLSPSESGYVMIAEVMFTPVVSSFGSYSLVASLGYNKTLSIYGDEEAGDSEDQLSLHSTYDTFGGPGSQSGLYSFYEYSSTNTKSLIAGLDEIESQIESINEDLGDLSDAIDAIEGDISDIPGEIEDAVSEAVQSLTGSLSSNFVSR